MPSCVSFGCTNRPGKNIPGISFHRFPKNPRLRDAWIKACKRANWMPSSVSILCSEHFSEDQIDRTSLTLVRLREDAVPNIFKAFPSYLQPVCEAHFEKSDILTEASAYDPKTGRTLTAPLGVKRLKRGAIPSLLIPSTDSPSSVRGRKDPEEKRIRIEKEQLSFAIKQSLKSIPGGTSQPEEAAECNFNAGSSDLRQTEDKRVEKKKTKRKRKSDKERILSKEINGISDLNSVELGQSSNIQEVSQNYGCSGSRNGLSSSSISSHTECSNVEQQNDSLHNQISSSSVSGIKENSIKNQVQVKEEIPWEEEYNFSTNTSTNKPEESRNDMVYLSMESFSNNENTESTSEKEMKEMMSESYNTAFYKKPLKIDKRDEAFGKFVACEMSDLRDNPQLYLKTQQSILKLLVEAHFEQMSSI